MANGMKEMMDAIKEARNMQTAGMEMFTYSWSEPQDIDNIDYIYHKMKIL